MAAEIVVDLTRNNSTGGFINGAFFAKDYSHPTGTGVFDPFLTIQANGVEQGYNTSQATVFDTKRVPQWNHELRMGDLAVVNLSGVDYYAFVVDVNEPNAVNKNDNKPLISLDYLKVWTSSSLQSTETPLGPDGAFSGSLGTLRYNLDTAANNGTVIYNDQNSGSGTADIQFFIPTANFAGASASDYMYMYQGWGYSYAADCATDLCDTQGGFEETRALLSPGTSRVSEPMSIALLGGALVSAGLAGRRRTRVRAGTV